MKKSPILSREGANGDRLNEEPRELSGLKDLQVHIDVSRSNSEWGLREITRNEAPLQPIKPCVWILDRIKHNTLNSNLIVQVVNKEINI